MELRDKVAFVTGSSSGIGRALALELAKNSCRLILTALEPQDMEEVVEQVRPFGIEVSARPADLSDLDERRALLEWVRRQPFPPDILVNNAGAGGRFGCFAGADLHDLERVITLNVDALIGLTHGLLPLLRTRPEARLVNVSSGVARLPYPGLAVYGATKAFISSFSESLACELADTNVKVLCFHPGFTTTGFMERSSMDMSKVPGWLVHQPEFVARRLVRALRQDRGWTFSDHLTGISARLGLLLPHPARIRAFSHLFWEVPNAN